MTYGITKPNRADKFSLRDQANPHIGVEIGSDTIYPLWNKEFSLDRGGIIGPIQWAGLLWLAFFENRA